MRLALFVQERSLMLEITTSTGPSPSPLSTILTTKNFTFQHRLLSTGTSTTPYDDAKLQQNEKIVFSKGYRMFQIGYKKPRYTLGKA